MTEAQIVAIGVLISTLAMIVGLWILGRRFLKLMDKPSWKKFLKFILDVAGTYLGVQIGVYLLHNMFVGILIGLWISWVISRKFDWLLEPIEWLLKVATYPVTITFKGLKKVVRRFSKTA